MTNDTELTPAAVPAKTVAGEGWAQDLIARVAFANLLEQRRARRWGLFFKFLIFVYLFTLLVLYFPGDWDKKAVIGKRHTALVSVEGLIAPDAEASAENVIEGLRAAVEDGNTAGVVLHINSPGGSPVQAGEIYDEILRLRKDHPDTPIYAVVADICASGGYYVAAAADRIFANRASIVGSIGVRADSFGFVEAMDKLGIERRLYTAGEHKAFLDPFTPPQPEDVRHLQGMLADIHGQFIAAVRSGRGERLRESPELYSGLIWTGEKSLGLGLVDELGSVRHVAEEVIGAREVVDYTRRPRFFEEFLHGIEGALAGALARVLGLGSPIR
ncbi:MAG: S49 family peptidase [Pseudomonadota bacterium]|nr:S49 family peptidase [Pseudomonadota bacterium]